eukprot:1808400-Pleurochrysis_carterae.AAC.2
MSSALRKPMRWKRYGAWRKWTCTETESRRPNCPISKSKVGHFRKKGGSKGCMRNESASFARTRLSQTRTYLLPMKPSDSLEVAKSLQENRRVIHSVAWEFRKACIFSLAVDQEKKYGKWGKGGAAQCRIRLAPASSTHSGAVRSYAPLRQRTHALCMIPANFRGAHTKS